MDADCGALWSRVHSLWVWCEGLDISLPPLHPRIVPWSLRCFDGIHRSVSVGVGVGRRDVCVFFVEPIVLSPLLCCTAVCSKTCTNGRGTRCASLCETAEVSLGQSWQRARVCVHPVISDTQGRSLSSFLLHETIWATWLSSVCVPRTSYKAFVSFPVFLPS